VIKAVYHGTMDVCTGDNELSIVLNPFLVYLVGTKRKLMRERNSLVYGEY